LNYKEAVDYILQIPKFTSKNDLSDTISLVKDLGNPEEEFKVIHVAGTNGKGSVCFYLDTLLQQEGKSVGRFTSPHLERINERIVINGKDISDERFLDAFHQTLKVVERRRVKGNPAPTFFEFIFGIALVAFRKAKVEVVVLETGLGGRLDATNAVARPIATVITSIGYDHMKQLGNTLGQIASEKAGIIKEGVPLVFASTTKESDDVIEGRARTMHSPSLKVSKEEFQIVKVENNSIAFSIKKDYYGKGLWTLKNIGVYQPSNALLALETMRILFGEKEVKDQTEQKTLEAEDFSSCKLSEEQEKGWRGALSTASWPGRLEEVRPGVVLDGAHNLNAITGFVKSISYESSPKIIVFGAMADKNVESMVRELTEGLEDANVEMYIVTRVSQPRSVEAYELQALFEKYTHKSVLRIEKPAEAMNVAATYQGNGKIYCLGSLYLIGEVRAALMEHSDGVLE